MKNWVKKNWIIILIALGLIYIIIIAPAIKSYKLNKCLDLASRREIEGFREGVLGYNIADYINNCYKLNNANR